MATTDLEQVGKYIFNMIKATPILVSMVGLNPVSKIIQVYEGKAPQSATFPYIEYCLMSNAPVRGGRNKRIFGRPKYYVKIVCQGNSESAYEYRYYEHYAVLRTLFESDQMSTDTVAIGCCITNELAYDDTNAGGQKQKHMVYQLEFFSYNN